MAGRLRERVSGLSTYSAPHRSGGLRAREALRGEVDARRCRVTRLAKEVCEELGQMGNPLNRLETGSLLSRMSFLWIGAAAEGTYRTLSAYSCEISSTEEIWTR